MLKSSILRKCVTVQRLCLTSVNGSTASKASAISLGIAFFAQNVSTSFDDVRSGIIVLYCPGIKN